MIKLKTGTNSFYIENDIQTTTLVDTYNILISNEFKNNNKDFNLDSVFVNDRYLKFDLELVSDSLEDLPNKKIYLTSGLNKIMIYYNTELIYTNILFVEYVEKDTFIYDNEEDNTFVYN